MPIVPRDHRFRRAVGAFLDLLPPGDVLVAGPSAAAEPIAARAPTVQIGVAGPSGVRGGRVRRAAPAPLFPSGVFAGCWSSAAGPPAPDLLRLVRPGGVLAVEGAAPGTLAGPGVRRVPLSGTGHAVEMVTASAAAPPGEPDCVFCPELRFRLNRIAGLPGAAAILAGDDAFFLIPDLAPIADGHLLLVSAEHHLCAGALPEPAWAQLRRRLGWAARLYQAAYGTAEVFAFEHGPARPQGAGACVDHLHLHLLPGTPALTTAIEATGLTGTAATAESVRGLHAAGRSYLLAGRTVYPVEVAMPQVLRWAALAAAGPGEPAVWRWQELFGLPDSRNRFLSTLDALLPAAAGRWLTGPRAATATSTAR